MDDRILAFDDIGVDYDETNFTGTCYDEYGDFDLSSEELLPTIDASIAEQTDRVRRMNIVREMLVLHGEERVLFAVKLGRKLRSAEREVKYYHQAKRSPEGHGTHGKDLLAKGLGVLEEEAAKVRVAMTDVEVSIWTKMQDALREVG